MLRCFRPWILPVLYTHITSSRILYRMYKRRCVKRLIPNILSTDSHTVLFLQVTTDTNAHNSRLRHIDIHIRTNIIFVQACRRIPILTFIPNKDASFTIIRCDQRITKDIATTGNSQISTRIGSHVFRYGIQPIDIRI